MRYCLLFPEYSTEAVEITELTIDQVTIAKKILMDQWGYTNYTIIYIDGNPTGYIITNDSSHFIKTLDFIILPLVSL